MCVVKGSNGFKVYTEENLRDPSIKELARRVRLEVDRDVEAVFPAKRAIGMTVKLKDGAAYQQWLDGARGTPENPTTLDEVMEKFRSLASVVLPDSRVEQIIQDGGRYL